ncbi:hypothetical protein DUPY_43900 [Duganella phyllosphaerae]|uniref:Uncharacterized protein n=1 Tax=Duganella phyllosphaerae TaxID=762836 RepID=A0A1E7WCF9_9BURK|nr:hypothetical protein DUPY_43900 [Duganella phyllosphaerae]
MLVIVMVRITEPPTSGSAMTTLANGRTVPPAATAWPPTVPLTMGTSLTDRALTTVPVLTALARPLASTAVSENVVLTVAPTTAWLSVGVKVSAFSCALSAAGDVALKV